MVILVFYKGVVMVFHWCVNEVIWVLQECYLRVTKVFLGCHKVGARLFQWSDMQGCHIRSDMSIVTKSDKSRLTSQELHVKSEKSKVTTQELQLKSSMSSRLTSCD